MPDAGRQDPGGRGPALLRRGRTWSARSAPRPSTATAAGQGDRASDPAAGARSTRAPRSGDRRARGPDQRDGARRYRPAARPTPRRSSRRLKLRPESGGGRQRQGRQGTVVRPTRPAAAVVPEATGHARDLEGQPAARCPNVVGKYAEEATSASCRPGRLRGRRRATGRTDPDERPGRQGDRHQDPTPTRRQRSGHDHGRRSRSTQSPRSTPTEPTADHAVDPPAGPSGAVGDVRPARRWPADRRADVDRRQPATGAARARGRSGARRRPAGGPPPRRRAPGARSSAARGRRSRPASWPASGGRPR